MNEEGKVLLKLAFGLLPKSIFYVTHFVLGAVAFGQNIPVVVLLIVFVIVLLFHGHFENFYELLNHDDEFGNFRLWLGCLQV